MPRLSAKEKSQHFEKIMIGVMMTIASSLCYALYSMFVKIAQAGHVSFYQISFFSFFISWLGMVPFLLFNRKLTLKTEHFGLHLLRLIFGVGIVYLFVPSLKYISLVDGVMLNNTAPIFIPLIAYFWLKHPLKHSIWIVLLCGIIGIGLILKPDQNILNLGGFLALLSGVGMAFSWVTIRKLTHVEPISRILFYFLTMSTIVAAIPLFWVWQSFPFIIWADLVVIGIFYLATTALFAFACKYISVMLVSILFYLSVVFTALLDWWIWQRLPDLTTTIGIILVAGSGITSILLENKKNKAPPHHTNTHQ